MKSYTYNDRNLKEYVYTEITTLETSCKSCGKQATYEYEVNGEHVGFYCSLCVGVLEKGVHQQFADELVLRGVNRTSIIFSNSLPPTKEEQERLAEAEAERRAKDPLFKNRVHDPSLVHATPVMPLAAGPDADLANRRLVEEKKAKEALARDNATRGVK